MANTVFYCVTPYDLQHLGYGGASFYWVGADRRWAVRFQEGPDGPQEFTLTKTDTTGARKSITKEVRQLPKGGTVLVVQYAIDHEKSDAPEDQKDRMCFTDIHMLPFDDGENFNRDRKRRNDWCPSSADSDWPQVLRASRFDRLDKYDN